MRGFVFVFMVLSLCACGEDPSPPPRAPMYPPPGYGYGPPPGQPGGPPPARPTGPPLNSNQISATVNAAYPTFTNCYMKSESYMTGRSGSVTMYFEVAQAGNVTRATDQLPPGVLQPASPLSDAKLNQCLAAVFQTLRFPAAGDTTQATWTFSFSP